MAAPIFEGWVNFNVGKYQKEHTIEIYGRSASWYEIAATAKAVSATLAKNELYVIDPSLGIDSIVSMLAVSMKQDVSFLWARPQSISSSLKKIADGIYVGPSIPEDRKGERLYYGTLTSGTTNTPKISMGFADYLPLIGLYYNNTLFPNILPNTTEKREYIATCLPMEYSATFMMVLLPAWFAARNLIVFKPDQWKNIFIRSKKEPITIITIPCLLSAACAAAPQGYDNKNLIFLTTAGYLSKKRISITLNKFPNASIQSSYGATETGVMTLDTSPTGMPHVGPKLYGKPIWLDEMNENYIGKIATTGVDGREFYLNDNVQIRLPNGVVASTDLGHFDNDGNLYLDGRIDKSEKLHGINIYPKQIESHLLKLDSILDVKITIYSEKDEKHEYIEALVVGQITEEELRNHCSTLEPRMQPKHFIIQSEENIQYTERGKLCNKNV